MAEGDCIPLCLCTVCVFAMIAITILLYAPMGAAIPTDSVLLRVCEGVLFCPVGHVAYHVKTAMMTTGERFVCAPYSSIHGTNLASFPEGVNAYTRPAQEVKISTKRIDRFTTAEYVVYIDCDNSYGGINNKYDDFQSADLSILSVFPWNNTCAGGSETVMVQDMWCTNHD